MFQLAGEAAQGFARGSSDLHRGLRAAGLHPGALKQGSRAGSMRGWSEPPGPQQNATSKTWSARAYWPGLVRAVPPLTGCPANGPQLAQLVQPVLRAEWLIPLSHTPLAVLFASLPLPTHPPRDLNQGPLLAIEPSPIRLSGVAAAPFIALSRPRKRSSAPA